MSLNDEAESIATVLSADGVQAFAYWDAALPVPCYSVATGNPYLEAGLVFGTFKSRWTVYVVVGSGIGDNSVPASQMRDLVEDAVVALANARYGIESVGSVQITIVGNASAVTLPITITKEISL